MKKLVLFASVLVAVSFASCGNKAEQASAEEAEAVVAEEVVDACEGCEACPKEALALQIAELEAKGDSLCEEGKAQLAALKENLEKMACEAVENAADKVAEAVAE